MQDRHRQLGKIHLQRTAGPYIGSIAPGRGKLQVQSCPQCPVSDGRPEKGGLS
jgi:hypothetical protein